MTMTRPSIMSSHWSRQLKTSGLVLALTLPILWQTGVAAQSTTLTGENFNTPSFFITGGDFSGCANPFQKQGSGFFQFSANGLAFGPFPGTFEESGVVDFFPDLSGKFFSHFKIFSSGLVIEGDKSGVLQQAFCVQGSSFSPTQGNFFGDTVRYSASIPTPSGPFQDSGVSFVKGFFGGANFFFEQFTSTAVLPPGPPAVLTLQPMTAVNPVGTTHTVTATVLDATGRPVPNVTVQFTVTGSISTSGSCQTNQNGQCSFTYSGPQFPGADLIKASSGVATGTATKAWIFPASTPGQKVTGGGQTLDFLTFGFNVQDQSGLMGHCNVIDHRGNHFKCLDVQSLVVTPPHATFFGNGTLNDVVMQYRIDVDDVDAPDGSETMFQDTFRILTSSGFSGGGTVVHGNIEIH
jgi:Bacterial Ig-like domain (group 1)